MCIRDSYCAAPIAFNIMKALNKKKNDTAGADGKPVLQGNRRFQ